VFGMTASLQRMTARAAASPTQEAASCLYVWLKSPPPHSPRSASAASPAKNRESSACSHLRKGEEGDHQHDVSQTWGMLVCVPAPPPLSPSKWDSSFFRANPAALQTLPLLSFERQLPARRQGSKGGGRPFKHTAHRADSRLTGKLQRAGIIGGEASWRSGRRDGGRRPSEEGRFAD